MADTLMLAEARSSRLVSPNAGALELLGESPAIARAQGEVRRAAAKELSEAGKEAKPAVTALTAALKDSDLYVRRFAAGVVTVTDDEIRAAMRFAFERLKLVLEPSGACALAALLFGKVDVRGARAGVTLSGGNVDPATFAACIVP